MPFSPHHLQLLFNLQRLKSSFLCIHLERWSSLVSLPMPTQYECTFRGKGQLLPSLSSWRQSHQPGYPVEKTWRPEELELVHLPSLMSYDLVCGCGVSLPKHVLVCFEISNKQPWQTLAWHSLLIIPHDLEGSGGNSKVSG